MKLVGTELGRVVQLVITDEIRPQHGIDPPRIVHAVATRYGFATSPTDAAGFTKPAGLRFERGRFVAVNRGEVPILDLSIFNDGIIAGCADTDLAGALVEDVVQWLVVSNLIRRPVTSIPRTYTSNVVAEFDEISEEQLERLFRSGDRLRAALFEQYGWDYATSLQRLAYSADPTETPRVRNTLFAIERRSLIPYKRKWFWSCAPLPTNRHLSLLRDLESDLADF